ncbi:MAG: dimethyl sulfoxide reductase anchor subunit [Proteobacteria bacterium]|nr:dimethyl sulfoxide reductase anchor subunit [Pseudomonadota bacterium]
MSGLEQHWPGRVCPAAPDNPIGGDTLISRLLREQQTLTAVESFSRWHDESDEPAQARYYRDLIPSVTPGPGQQYAFEVKLDDCTGCKSCVAACHNLNGLDSGELWRHVGTLHGGTATRPVQMAVTTACHHCLDPACLHGCPVQAYEKDTITGIVRHLDDQCIGCQYCLFTCPYQVPVFNRARGIVRKCDMCSERLAVKEAPACVQACPQQAIAIAVVDRDQVVKNSETGTTLPGAPSPHHTFPTTTYRSMRPLPANLLAADYFRADRQHAHPALVIFLVLSQSSVGVFALNWFFGPSGGHAAHIALAASLGLVLGVVGLAASAFHVGRPRYMFRAVLGLRTSWLSREAVAFAGFTLLAMVYVAHVWLIRHGAASPRVLPFLAAAVVIAGSAGVVCSAMVYITTARPFWRSAATAAKFVATAVILGAALSGWMVIAWSGALPRHLYPLLALVTLAKLGLEASVFIYLNDRHHSSLRRTAVLMSQTLGTATRARFAVSLVGGVLLPLFLCLQPGAGLCAPLLPWLAGAIAVLCLVGEVLERYLFFAAVFWPKMPGRRST